MHSLNIIKITSKFVEVFPIIGGFTIKKILSLIMIPLLVSVLAACAGEDTPIDEDVISENDVAGEGQNEVVEEDQYVEVDKEAFENSFDGFAAFGLGLSGLFYQLFNGANPDVTS